MKKYIVIMLLGLFVGLSSVYGQSVRFQRLRDHIQYSVKNSDGSFFLFMVQMRPNGETVYLERIREKGDQWYCTVFDQKGNVKGGSRYIDGYNFTTARALNYSWGWLEDDRNVTVLTEGGNEDLVVNRFAKTGPGLYFRTFEVLISPTPIALTNREGDLYAVLSTSSNVELALLDSKPSEKLERKTLLNRSVPPAFNGIVQVSSEFCAAVTAEYNIIICLRSYDSSWDDKAAFYSVTDFEGKDIAQLKKIDIKRYAYHKVRNFALPGVYEYDHSTYAITDRKKLVSMNFIFYGFDVVKLPNGLMVLAVTAFDNDKNKTPCTYLIKMDGNGQLIKPDKMKTVDPKPIGDGAYPVNRGGLTSTYKSKSNTPTKYDMVLYGFDADGNLYVEKFPLGEYKY